MSANEISHLPTKQQRQVAKLALATTDRAASGRPSILDIDTLPTRYVGNDVVDNPGPLIEGRPWS